MSRSGYNEDCDGWDLIRWRGAVNSALKGQRGQALLADMAVALDAMPVKRLIEDELISAEGEVCALGAVAKHKSLKVDGIDPYDSAQVCSVFNIAEALAREIAFINDGIRQVHGKDGRHPLLMSNALALEELRREGFVPWVVEVSTGPLKRDLWSFADVIAYDPTHLRRWRLVNACGEDVQAHIRKYLEGGTDKKTGRPFPPNVHLQHLIPYADLFLYSFVLRTFKTVDGKRSSRKVYDCRKWQAILSPSGSISFERQP